jgi:alkylation response protein AidB-like acyl-CoA dehydrogenase
MLGSAARFVGGQGIQLHGGIGMTDEYQVGHYYKRLLTLEKMYGDSDWHLDRMVRAQREAA